ncbi:unnamed protein product, partial [marine sediment metagenome]
MTKQNKENREIIKALRQFAKKLHEWIKEHRYSKRCGWKTFEQTVDSVRDSILRATDGLEAAVRKMRLLNYLEHANLIKEAYQNVLDSVDAAKLQKEKPLSQQVVTLSFGLVEPKERVQELADTLEDVAQSLEERKLSNGKRKAAEQAEKGKLKPARQLKNRFSFNAGQVLFDDIDLGIRASAVVVLQMLVDKFGQ